MNTNTALQVDDAVETLLRQLNLGISLCENAFSKHDQVVRSITCKATKDSQNILFKGVLLARFDSHDRDKDIFYNLGGRIGLFVRQFGDAVRADSLGRPDTIDEQHRYERLLLRTGQIEAVHQALSDHYRKSVEDRGACAAMVRHMKEMKSLCTVEEASKHVPKSVSRPASKPGLWQKPGVE